MATAGFFLYTNTWVSRSVVTVMELQNKECKIRWFFDMQRTCLKEFFNILKDYSGEGFKRQKRECIIVQRSLTNIETMIELRGAF